MPVKAILDGQQLCCLKIYVLSYLEIEKQLRVVAHDHGGVPITPVIVICSIYGYCPGHNIRVTSLHHVPPRWNRCMTSVFGGQDLSRKPLLFQRRSRSTSFTLPSKWKVFFEKRKPRLFRIQKLACSEYHYNGIGKERNIPLPMNGKWSGNQVPMLPYLSVSELAIHQRDIPPRHVSNIVGFVVWCWAGGEKVANPKYQLLSVVSISYEWSNPIQKLLLSMLEGSFSTRSVFIQGRKKCTTEAAFEVELVRASHKRGYQV